MDNKKNVPPFNATRCKRIIENPRPSRPRSAGRALAAAPGKYQNLQTIQGHTQ